MPPLTDLVRSPRARVAAVALGVSVLAGAPLGLLWARFAPQLELRQAAQGSESAFSAQVGADLAFLLLMLIAGAVAALVALKGPWRRGDRGPVDHWTVLGLLVGGLVAALVAARVGRLYRLPGLLERLREGVTADQVGYLDFRLRARALVLAWPAATLVTSMVIDAVRTSRAGAGTSAAPHQPAYTGRWGGGWVSGEGR